MFAQRATLQPSTGPGQVVRREGTEEHHEPHATTQAAYHADETDMPQLVIRDASHSVVADRGPLFDARPLSFSQVAMSKNRFNVYTYRAGPIQISLDILSKTRK